MVGEIMGRHRKVGRPRKVKRKSKRKYVVIGVSKLNDDKSVRYTRNLRNARKIKKRMPKHYSSFIHRIK
jgi:hypothetical protein